MAKKVAKKNPEKIRKSDSHMYDGENEVDPKLVKMTTKK